jgi:hypothetical protein
MARNLISNSGHVSALPELTSKDTRSSTGQTVKFCNRLTCGINIQAICEALALGRASGVADPLTGIELDFSIAARPVETSEKAVPDRVTPVMKTIGTVASRLPSPPDRRNHGHATGTRDYWNEADKLTELI